MTTTYDLRNLLVLPAVWAPDDPPAGPDPSPDDAAPPAGDVAGEGDQEPAPEADTGRPDNPGLKKLHDEAARNRVRAKDAEAKVTVLTDQVRSLHLRLAFNAAATDATITDTEAAWKLAADDLRAVDVAEDGTVDATRLGQILTHVADRYPYLAAAPATTATASGFPPAGPSGRQTNGKRNDTRVLDEQRLISKFPALGRAKRPGR